MSCAKEVSTSHATLCKHGQQYGNWSQCSIHASNTLQVAIVLATAVVPTQSAGCRMQIVSHWLVAPAQTGSYRQGQQGLWFTLPWQRQLQLGFWSLDPIMRINHWSATPCPTCSTPCCLGCSTLGSFWCTYSNSTHRTSVDGSWVDAVGGLAAVMCHARYADVVERRPPEVLPYPPD